MPQSAKNLWVVPNLLLQKPPTPEFTVTSRIHFGHLGQGQKTGLIVMGMNYSYLAVERDASGFHIARYTCINASDGNPEKREHEARLPGTTALLRVRVSTGALCDFSFSGDGKTFAPIGGRFKAREGRWIGAKIGLFCVGVGRQAAGHADFDWFRFGR